MGGAEFLRAEVEQPLDHDERIRADVLRGAQSPAAGVVSRLQDGFSTTEVREVLTEDVEMVGGRIQGCDAKLGPLLAPVSVIVGPADVGAVLWPAEDGANASRPGGLP